MEIYLLLIFADIAAVLHLATRNIESIMYRWEEDVQEWELYYMR